MKTKNVKILILLGITLLIMLIPINVNAAGSFSISRGSASLNPGGTTTITISASDCAGQFSISSSDSSVASVSTSSTWLDNSSITVTVTAKSAGTANINITASDVTDTDLNDVTGTKTCTISVTNPEPVQEPSSNTQTSSGNSTTTKTTTPEKPKEVVKSSVSTLKELEIEGVTISPEFSVDIREYTASVPYEVTSLNVTAKTVDSKAKVEIKGNEDLKEGENEIVLTVTAEDKTTSKYVVTVTRLRQPLVLKGLVVKYTNQEGELVELPLNPVFDINTLEYSLEDIEYWVDKLFIEAEANLQDAVIDVQGAENLVVGENTITVTVTLTETTENSAEGEEPREEKIICKIKVNKLAEPTFWEKVKDKIKLIFGGISNWYNSNQEKIVVYSLCACVAALIILSVYIVVDYKKYKMLLEKLGKLEEINSQEIIEETVAEGVVKNQILKGSNENEETEEKPEIPARPRRGKHF